MNRNGRRGFNKRRGIKDRRHRYDYGFDDEEDDTQFSPQQQSNFNCFPTRRGRPQRGDHHNRRNFRDPIRNHLGTGGYGNQKNNRQMTWCRVTISKARELTRTDVMEALTSHLGTTLHPILYRMHDNGDILFYVDDIEQGESLKSANRRIALPSGQKMELYVTKTQPPFVPLPKEEMTVLLEILSTCYDAQTGLLNLKNFNQRQAVQERGMGGTFSPLRNSVMMEIVKIVGQNCPNVVSIDASENRLRNLDYFGNVVSRASQVTKLDLSHNQIDHVRELDKLRGWNIIELNLDMNPICNNYQGDQAAYVSAIRKIFPRIQMLDGCALPAPVGFDLDEPSKSFGSGKSLPLYKPSFFVEDDMKAQIADFVQSYFSIYDSDNREGLWSFYSDIDCTFTSTAFALGSSFQTAVGQSDAWKNMIFDSHNILHEDKWSRRRQKVLHKGKLAILKALSDLPKTEHELRDGFLVDINFLLPDKMVSFNLTGLFRQPETDMMYRLCNRMFILVVEDGRPKITNDMLFVTLLEESQKTDFTNLIDRANKTAAQMNARNVQQHQPAGLPIHTGATSVIAGTSAVLPPPPHVTTTTTGSPLNMSNAQMISEFMAATGMLREWAEKCLSEHAYDGHAAMAAFNQLRLENKIPPAAFGQ